MTRIDDPIEATEFASGVDSTDGSSVVPDERDDPERRRPNRRIDAAFELETDGEPADGMDARRTGAVDRARDRANNAVSVA